jgi:hypothetical protein
VRCNTGNGKISVEEFRGHIMRKPFGQFIAIGIVALLNIQPVHAILLSLVPSSATVTTGNTVDVDVIISGLGNPPSVGTFDLDIGFNTAILAPTAVTFGAFLGDPALFEALTAFDFGTPGRVEFAEVSLLSPSELDALQQSSFSLATLSFSAIANGTSPFFFAGNQIVDDAFGNKLPIPEPATVLLLAAGLIALRTIRRPLRRSVSIGLSAVGPSHWIKRPRRFGACCLVIAMALAPLPNAALAQEIRSGLSTTAGARIPGDDLAKYLNNLLDTSTTRLVILTECYGGSTALSFMRQANTAVISGTTSGVGGQTGVWGGYDKGAANALKPGAGTTAQTVHDAGIASKDTSETPSIRGGIKPQDYPLESITNVSAVKSRHILFYAGKPDRGDDTSDVAQRDRIKMNFADEMSTKIRTAGGDGKDGWDYPGSAAGLQQALKDIAKAIKDSGNPASSEQFILYVGDHGNRDKTDDTRKKFPAKSNGTLSNNFSTFTSIEFDPADLNLASDPSNPPGFSIFIPFDPTDEVTYPSTGSFFNPGDWTLSLQHVSPGGQDFTLINSYDQAYELDGDNILGNTDASVSEGIRVVFLLLYPINSPQFASSFFDATYNVVLANNTSTDYTIDSFSQDSGSINKREPLVPELCDVNGDGKIDFNDINAIFAARNTPASGPNDPRDPDRNGIITVNDARICVNLCTNAHCAP